MTTRNILAAAAASLVLIGGTAFASERQIDYTGQHLTMSRAEVVADTRAFNAMYDGALANSNEAYGRTDALASMWSGTPTGQLAEIPGDERFEVRGNEAYGGFPEIAGRQGRGE